ncbi:hypothetical protein GQ53DRAFT_617749, partial [Thozetella sp. PMI_491]
MRPHNAMNDEEASDASREAAKGAVYGALKFGAATAALGGLGYLVSPIYRGLTVQFKVYLQMSGMILGSWIEADLRLRQYEAKIRTQRRLMRDRAMWQTYEKEYGKEDE